MVTQDSSRPRKRRIRRKRADIEMGERIAAARRAAGITGEELARRLGMTRQAVSRIERGWGTSLATLRRIAVAEGTTPGALVNGEVPTP